MIHQPNKDRTTTPPKGSGNNDITLTWTIISNFKCFGKMYLFEVEYNGNKYGVYPGVLISDERHKNEALTKYINDFILSFNNNFKLSFYDIYNAL